MKLNEEGDGGVGECESVYGPGDPNMVYTTTHRRKFREQDEHASRKVDKEQLGIILDIMSRDQEPVRDRLQGQRSRTLVPDPPSRLHRELTGRSERSSTISWRACIERPHRFVPTMSSRHRLLPRVDWCMGERVNRSDSYDISRVS